MKLSSGLPKSFDIEHPTKVKDGDFVMLALKAEAGVYYQ